MDSALLWPTDFYRGRGSEEILIFNYFPTRPPQEHICGGLVSYELEVSALPRRATASLPRRGSPYALWYSWLGGGTEHAPSLQSASCPAAMAASQDYLLLRDSRTGDPPTAAAVLRGRAAPVPWLWDAPCPPAAAPSGITSHRPAPHPSTWQDRAWGGRLAKPSWDGSGGSPSGLLKNITK